MFKLSDIKFRKGKRTQPFEYWCMNCKQLRYSTVDVSTCGNCGSDRIIKGDIGKLERK